MPLIQNSRAEYDALDALNWSRLKVTLSSAAKYKHALTQPREDTGTFAFGRVFHLALLEPEKLASEVVIYDGHRAGKVWDAFEAAHVGQEILKTEAIADAIGMATALRSDPEIAPLLPGRHELTATATVDGRARKGRIDILSRGGLLIDPKSTTDASPEGFARSVEKFAYLGQMAWYFDLLDACGERPLGTALLAVEKTAPYDHALYTLSDDDLEAGRGLYRRALAVVERCEWSESWPGYKSIQPLQRPRWATTQVIEEDEE